MGRRRGAGGAAGHRPERPSPRWRDHFMAEWRLARDPTEAPGATLHDFFPGISWEADLHWGMRRRR